MKYLIFGGSKTQHRLAFRLRRGKRVLHSKCGIRMGANDRTIVSEESSDFGCEKCAEGMAEKSK